MFAAKLRVLLAVGTLVLAGGAVHASQTHWYQLNGNLNDTQGGPSLVANGGSFAGGSYNFGPNQGLSLSGALTSDVYSIDLTFSFGPKTNWSKIVDFNDLSADAGWYRFNSVLQLCSCGTQVNSVAGAFVDNQSVRVTLTRDAGQMVNQYVNGSFAGSYLDSSNAFTFNQPGSIAHFFVDDHATGQSEAASGSVSRIVIFDNALTANQVATLSPVPEPESYALLLAGLGLVAGFVRRRQRG